MIDTFVKFTLQRPNESDPIKYAWVRVGQIVSVTSMTFDFKPKLSNSLLKKDGCIISTANNASYVAHTYTAVVNLIEDAMTKESLF